MPAAVEDPIVQSIDERLDWLRGEIEKHESAKAELVNGATQTKRAPRTRKQTEQNGSESTAAKAPRTKKTTTLVPELDKALGKAPKAPRGARTEQFMTIVRERPGITAVDVAKAMAIAPTQVYALVKKTRKQGLLQSGDYSSLTVAEQ